MANLQHCVKHRITQIRASCLTLYIYIGIRQAIQAVYPDYPEEPPTLRALQAMLSGEGRRGLVPKLYNASMRERERGIHSSCLRWEAMLGTTLTPEVWTACCQLTGRLTANCNLRIIHFKFIHQLYYTPVQLRRYGLRETANCVRCGMADADFIHVAWLCLGVSTFWSTVVKILSEIVLEPVPCTPELCLLGYMKSLKSCNRRLVAVSTLLAKRAIAQCWGAKSSPTVKRWLRDLIYCRDQILIYEKELPESSRPKDFWSPLTTYLLSQPDLL